MGNIGHRASVRAKRPFATANGSFHQQNERFGSGEQIANRGRGRCVRSASPPVKDSAGLATFTALLAQGTRDHTAAHRDEAVIAALVSSVQTGRVASTYPSMPVKPRGAALRPASPSAHFRPAESPRFKERRQPGDELLKRNLCAWPLNPAIFSVTIQPRIRQKSAYASLFPGSMPRRPGRNLRSQGHGDRSNDPTHP